MIQLNEGQLNCLNKLMDWWENYDGSKQVFSISGLAGCGKTFVIRYLIDTLDDINLENVLFVAYVGKAAMQMTKSGVKAKTIHSTIYFMTEVAKKDKDGNVVKDDNGRSLTTFKFFKRDNLSPEIKLIVVDEAPMVDERVAKDLLSFGLPIIALGDLHQLPPVIGKSYFLKNPDATLTEIMRQKSDSPILKLAEYVIKSPIINLRPTTFGDKLMIIKKNDFMSRYQNALLTSDIVICGKNSTRNELNKIIRSLYFKSLGVDYVKDLMVGDKIICRKNNWSKEVEGISLINGLVGNVVGINYELKTTNTISIDFKPDFITDYFENISLNIPYFTGSKAARDAIKLKPHDGELFEYGYAITCHLSQGSQYEKVIVFVEKMGDNEFFRKWLYTAITRASDKLILII